MWLSILSFVNISVYSDSMSEQVPVQLRVPKKTVENIDSMVKEGQFKSRSDAIKSIIFAYEEREKTRKFYMLLEKRSKESKENPDTLIPLSEL
tara:strand:- start:3849 stop:4127 length:279 start_codon:yes stop_codon:yes gene_type:complete